MRGDVLWPLLFGSALTLVTTLVAQWSSLAYQTSRQRQARRADSQRTTLLQLQNTLLEVQGVVDRAMDTRRRLVLEFEKDNRDPAELQAFLMSHPDQALLSSILWRLERLASGTENEPLLDAIWEVLEWGYVAPTRPTDEGAQDARDSLFDAQRKVADMIGEQLRKLP